MMRLSVAAEPATLWAGPDLPDLKRPPLVREAAVLLWKRHKTGIMGGRATSVGLA